MSAAESGPEQTPWPLVAPEEAEVIRESGIRLHVAEVEAFWVAHSQDVGTTTLGFLARTIELHLDLQPGRHRFSLRLWIAAPEDLLEAPSKPR